MTMSDHQESEHFVGVRDEKTILTMLDKAERKKNMHYTQMHKGRREQRVYHMRNYKALEGVVKTLRWVLGDMNIDHPLE
tara:strand:- start:2746 stop:2982 length:237 start_codon:yes stop_codon:yes gene_type:complete